MNWRRGLTRLWVFGSLALTVFVGCCMWEEAGNTCHWINAAALIENRAPDCNLLAYFFFYTVVVSAPASLAVFILGAGVLWVLRGFQRKAPQA